MIDTSKLRQRTNRLLAEYTHASATVRDEQAHLVTAQAALTTAERVQEIIQTVAQSVQELAHTRIASVVTRCLEAVFGDDAYEFRVVFERKRGKTEARLVFLRNGQELDPIEDSGGGCVDVAALALRLQSIFLARPPLRRVLILDEPAKFLSENHAPRFRALLEALAMEMQLQLILVTHNRKLVCGKVVDLSGD
jgi:DNA repair exonuclease SbcCD ATPase subunit